MTKVYSFRRGDIPSGAVRIRPAPDGSVRRRTDTPKKWTDAARTIHSMSVRRPHGRPSGRFKPHGCRTDVRAAPDGRRTDAGRTSNYCPSGVRAEAARTSVRPI